MNDGLQNFMETRDLDSTEGTLECRMTANSAVAECVGIIPMQPIDMEETLDLGNKPKGPGIRTTSEGAHTHDS